MTRVLLTAFEPFGSWQSNSSWRLVVELTRQLPATPEVVTRLYPVDFAELPRKLGEDLAGDFDYAIHLGQNEKATGLEFERFAVNVGVDSYSENGREFALVDHGPAAYKSQLPLEDWAEGIRQLGAPASVSYHAGEYCCNATYYFSQHHCRTNGLKTETLFIHVPLTPEQTAEQNVGGPSLEASRAATAMRYLLDQLVKRGAQPRS